MSMILFWLIILNTWVVDTEYIWVNHIKYSPHDFILFLILREGFTMVEDFIKNFLNLLLNKIK